MARPVSDPSGAAVTVCVTLSPARLTALDAAAAARGLSRSTTVAQLIERCLEPSPALPSPPRSLTGASAECAHKTTRFTGTMTVCTTCKAVKGSGGTWRTPK